MPCFLPSPGGLTTPTLQHPSGNTNNINDDSTLVARRLAGFSSFAGTLVSPAMTVESLSLPPETFYYPQPVMSFNSAPVTRAGARQAEK